MPASHQNSGCPGHRGGGLPFPVLCPVNPTVFTNDARQQTFFPPFLWPSSFQLVLDLILCGNEANFLFPLRGDSSQLLPPYSLWFLLALTPPLALAPFFCSLPFSHRSICTDVSSPPRCRTWKLPSVLSNHSLPPPLQRKIVFFFFSRLPISV